MVGPLENIVQTVNNCGPASVAEVLHFWGIDRTQNELQSILRPDDPYGMTTVNLPGYVQSLGMKVMIGTSGSQPLMKALLANGFPLIANQMVSVTDGTFHYRAIDGYDDSKSAFISSDPLLGPDYPIPYDQFDTVWLATGRTFIVIYPPAQDALLQSVLASNSWSPGAYAVGAAVDHSPPVTTASVRGSANPNGSYAGPVTVSLSATDIGSGVAQITYRVDGGVVQNYGRPFTVSGGGKHTVSFRAADYAGNLEAEQSLTLVIAGAGGAPPSTSWSVTGTVGADGSYAAGAQLVLTAHDSGTGVQGVQYALNGGNPQAYNGPIALPSGSDAITYQATDLAGDVEPLRSVTVQVADAPASAAAVVPPTVTRTPTRTNTPTPISTPTPASTIAASATTQAPSATAAPPTATRVPPSATSVPNTATPANTATRAASPTSLPTVAPTATAPHPTATPH
ncbi:MAG: C39 family peptidase [Acidimicrobiia bacterium]|nr:C39 family peptidase [Acidimicrobiia bacterium]